MKERETAVAALLPEIASITRRELREQTRLIWAAAWEQSAWHELTDCPTAPNMPTRSLVDHTRAVVSLSLAVADALAPNGSAVDRDALLCVALLHDVSKLVEFEPAPSGEGCVESATGRRLQHGFLAAAWMSEHGMDEELVHAVLAHTKRSTTVPDTAEAIIVHYADHLEADLGLHAAGLGLLCA